MEASKAFKRFQRGELDIDDLFCISPNKSIWFNVKKVEEAVKEREFENEQIKSRINDDLSQSLETASGFDTNKDFELDSIDVSSIDPMREFGFLVIGHEFDHYSKQMIREIKNWNWFLDDSKGYTDDEDNTKKKGSTSRRRKRKKTSREDDGDVDEEWTVENEGDEVAKDARKVQRPKYITQSKVQGVHDKGTTNRESSIKTSRSEEEEETEDEEDERFGGFVVNDDVVEEDEVDEDDEVEFIEDEDEEELED
ncbi:hypothetical protein RDABS01_018166 [Bienertia sinuspersici]